MRGPAGCPSVLLHTVLSLMALSCGAARATPRAPITAGGEVHEVGEGSVVLLTRPSAEDVLVQLWIDAGSLDATEERGAPELASLAAWIAEARGGASIHARVVPDGTVFVARAATLPEALGPLARALATREPSDAELAAAREILRARRRGRARDPLAALEAQAAALLLGNLDPLGLEPAGTREIELDEVRSFLSAHYGPSRVRWVVVGDLDVNAVRDAVLVRTTALPSAEHEAGRRHLIEGPRSLALDDRAGWSLALLGPLSEIGGPTGLASAPAERLAHFPTPCGELGLVSASGTLDEERVRALRFALAVGPTPIEGDSDAAADAERAGLRFVSRSERCDTPVTSPTRAWVVSAPDHSERQRRRVDASFGEARSFALHHTDVDGHTALLALSLRGGALEDPASMHGRTAILGRALSLRCGVSARVAPDALSIDVALDADSPAAFEASLARALSCVLLEPVPAAFLETARAASLAALDADALFLAAAARAIAPSTPGLVAPSGDAAGLVSASELDAALQRLRTTARLGVGVVSPFAPSEAFAAALGALSPGEGFEPTPGSTGPHEVFLPSIEATLTEVIVTLRLDSGAHAAPADARAVATLLSTELDASPLSVTRFASGSEAGVSWVAIALTGPDEAIDALDTHVAAAVARCEPGLEAALEAQRADRVRERADRSTRASEVARGLFTDLPLEPDALASATLLHAPPHRVVVRPSTPPFRRR